MKNKTVTYVLLTGVLFIWGVVFYKIFAGMGSEDVASYELPQKKVAQILKQDKEETLVLLANYRDPFLGITSRTILNSGLGNSSLTQRKKIKTEPVKKEVIDWSFLDYIGIINNKETKKQVGLLVVFNKEYMVNDKDVINDVTIIKKEKDSILVEYRKEQKWIRR
jgi:hypothetical protein